MSIPFQLFGDCLVASCAVRCDCCHSGVVVFHVTPYDWRCDDSLGDCVQDKPLGGEQSGTHTGPVCLGGRQSPCVPLGCRDCCVERAEFEQTFAEPLPNNQYLVISTS